MLRILAPTDFSTDGYNATLVAMQLAQRFAAEVIFVHAMAKPPVPAASPESLFQTVYQDEERKHRERLREECQHLHDILDMRHGEVLYKTLVVPTPFADSMMQVIAREKIDLIVMGNKGSSNLKQILMGSNTLELIRISPIPLLTIPSDVVFNGFESITVLVEQKALAYRSGIDILERLARSYNAHLHFVILTKDGKLLKNVSELLEQPDEWQYLLELPYTTTIMADLDALSELEQHVGRTRSELLVLLPDRRSIWEDIFSRNIAEELASKARIPLLIVPSQPMPHA
jgi:nucleotide-binding universal stress UspA family protein